MPLPAGMRRPDADRGRWYCDAPPAGEVALGDLPAHISTDLADDIRRILDVMRSDGFERAVLVDLTPGERDYRVVRIVAPEFETMLIDHRFGSRTLQLIAGLERQ